MMLALKSVVTPDRRSGDRRYRPVLLIGRVEGAGAPVCLVHDISAEGLMARFPDPPAVGDSLSVEVRGLPPIRATVRWIDGPKAGLRFDERQDVTRLFAIQREDGTVARAPRFPLAAPAQLRLGERRLAAELVDLSAGGAKLALTDPVQRGETGALHLSAIDAPLFGALCWSRDDRAGFRFAAPLTLPMLSGILKATPA